MLELLLLAAIANCPADLNGDRLVGQDDLVLLLSQWGPCEECAPDFNSDGFVDFADQLELLASWGPCPFNVVLDKTAGAPVDLAKASSLLVLGDSIVGDGVWNRMFGGILKTWDIRWGGFHATGTNGLADYRNVGGIFDGGTSRDVRRVTDPSLGGHYFGLPMGRMADFDLGAGFTPESPVDRLRLQPEAFGVGTVEDWFTGSDLNAEMLFAYRGGQYVADVRLDDTIYVFADHATDDIDTDGPGLNLLPSRSIGGLTLSVDATSDWSVGADKRWGCLGFRVTGGPGNVFAGVLADSSWDSHEHATNAPASPSRKSYTNDELDRYLDLMFEDKNTLVVVVVEGPENTSLGQYVQNNHDRNDRITERWLAVGGEDVKFIYVGLYRTSNDALARRQNEAAYLTAIEREDTFYVSLYALLGGILWDGESSEQESYAIAHGWDAISMNNGLLDMSRRDGLDAGKIHPADAEAAFFYAWVIWEQIK